MRQEQTGETECGERVPKHLQMEEEENETGTNRVEILKLIFQLCSQTSLI